MKTWADLNIDIPPGRISGQVYTKCPQCSHDRKKKNQKCLGVNLNKQIYHCNHCGWKGSLEKKSYSLPSWENRTDLSDKVVDWFLSRNISQATLIKMKVTEKKEWMPQVNAERNVICFNYFRSDKLVNIKYRDAEKNFKMYKDAELIFYNIDAVKDEVYITEGEIDCLTMIQCGYENTISVPNGASKGNNNLQYLDNCYTYFENVKKVYILTDNDEPGIKLGQELARRIGIEKCFRIDLGPYKDINEQYSKVGSIDISKQEPYPIEGIFSISQHWDSLLDILKNGFPKGWKPRGKLGEHVQFHPGYTTIVTGIPGHGKSEMLDQILLELAMDYGLRGGYFSPENRPTEMHIMKLIEKLIGYSCFKAREHDLLSAKGFLDSKMYWIYPSEGYSLDSILEKTRQAVLRHGINWYVIDPWNKIEHQYEGSETKYISECLDKIANFNHQNGTHCFLVAHPTKMKFDRDTGKYEIPGLYDISGSANFFNKADIGITVYKDNVDENTFRSYVYVQKVKFKYWGEQGQIEFTWNKENGRYSSDGFDHTNWIRVKHEEQLINFSEPRQNDEVPF